MNDTLKTIIGAVAGFVLGVLSEPLKFVLAEMMRKRQVRRALYGNIAFFCGQLLYLKHLHSKRSDEGDTSNDISEEELRIWQSLDLDLFDYYYTSERANFWRIQYAGRMRELYTIIRPGLETGSSLPTRLEVLDHFLQFLAISVHDGYVQKRILARFFKSYFQNDLEKQLRPYLTSYLQRNESKSDWPSST